MNEATACPRPWRVRTMPDGTQPFVEASAPDRPYAQEVLADDSEYWPEFSKAADVELIVEAVNSFDANKAKIEALTEAAKSAIAYIEETDDYQNDAECRAISDQLAAAITTTAR